jgi:hypothetical protein
MRLIALNRTQSHAAHRTTIEDIRRLNYADTGKKARPSSTPSRSAISVVTTDNALSPDYVLCPGGSTHPSRPYPRDIGPAGRPKQGSMTTAFQTSERTA